MWEQEGIILLYILCGFPKCVFTVSFFVELVLPRVLLWNFNLCWYSVQLTLICFKWNWPLERIAYKRKGLIIAAIQKLLPSKSGSLFVLLILTKLSSFTQLSLSCSQSNYLVFLFYDSANGYITYNPWNQLPYSILFVFISISLFLKCNLEISFAFYSVVTHSNSQ